MRLRDSENSQKSGKMNLANLTSVDPENIIQGLVVFLAPHMDDEILACGGTIAALSQRNHIHIVYATDGSRSPVPMFPWVSSKASELAAIRAEEARQALALYDIPDDNITFLGLSDGRLNRHFNLLTHQLSGIFKALEPSWVMIPFRFDRHPDHVALNQASLKAISKSIRPCRFRPNPA